MTVEDELNKMADIAACTLQVGIYIELSNMRDMAVRHRWVKR